MEQSPEQQFTPTDIAPASQQSANVPEYENNRQTSQQLQMQQFEEMLYEQQQIQALADEQVPIKQQPFIQVTVPEQPGTESVFDEQIFLIRQVQAEDKTLVQGFKLNDQFLLEEVRESANRLMRDGMTFDLEYGSNKTDQTEKNKTKDNKH